MREEKMKDEFISKIQICIQEADETQRWLECLKEGCCSDDQNISGIWRECDELTGIFTSSARTARQNNIVKEEMAES
jgi:four helix bundle protein